MKIAIILPAYNEELTIVDTMLDFFNELPQADIIVVDNNSKDKTYTMAAAAYQEHGIKGYLIKETRQGKGHAVRKAFSEVEADIYIMADADLTYPAKDVHQLMKPVLEGMADIVIGDRQSGGQYKKENKRNLHGLGNNLVKNMINILFKADLKDIMSGYRVFNRKFVKNYPIMIDGFQLETDMTLHTLDKRFKIIELPINFVDRPEGSFSKLNTIADGIRVLSTIINIFRIYRPFSFYSIFSVLFALLSLSAAIPVFNDWITHRYIYHIPLAILATGLSIVSILSLSLALILNAITHQHNVDFEYKILKFRSEY